jgi:hypothetical protein
MKTPLPTKHISRINKLRRLSKVMDNAIAIPGTKFRFGLDPIFGLLPGGGDTITGGLSAYIVVEAARMGLPREILYKMVGNILIDSFAGAVPIIGDLFDVGWKSNVKNIELLEKHLEIAEDSKSNTLFIIGLIILLTIIILGFAAITVFTVGWLWNLINN